MISLAERYGFAAEARPDLQGDERARTRTHAGSPARAQPPSPFVGAWTIYVAQGAILGAAVLRAILW